MDTVRLQIAGRAKTERKRLVFVGGTPRRVDTPDRQSWKARVAEAAYAAYEEAVADGAELPFSGPVLLHVIYVKPLPKSRPSKPTKKWPLPTAFITKPDIVDNLTKPLIDACSGILWHDDQQIVAAIVAKVYQQRPAAEQVFIAAAGNFVTPEELEADGMRFLFRQLQETQMLLTGRKRLT